MWSYRALSALLVSDAEAALASARPARELADVEHLERDIIRAEWLLGAALVAGAPSIEDKRSTLAAAEAHLSAALTRCSKINLVELEPDILLAWARWQQLSGNPAQARAHAHAALAIAERCEYRLKQADANLLLARLDLEAGNRAAALGHAKQARERAWCDGPPHCYKPALDAAERLLGELGR